MIFAIRTASAAIALSLHRLSPALYVGSLFIALQRQAAEALSAAVRPRQGQRLPIDEPSILISCRLITSKGTLDALLVILSPADKSAEITKMHVHLFIKQTDVDE